MDFFPVKIGVNYKHYDINLARTEKSYAKNFTYGWTVCVIKSWDELATTITKHVWSPIIFDGPQRKTEHFVEARLMVLDFDDFEISLAQTVNEWSDTACLFGFTKSHQLSREGKMPCDRFRLVAFFNNVITSASDYYFNMKSVISKYGADNSCKDGARLFFPCTTVVEIIPEGETLDVKAPPPPQAPKDYSAYREFRDMPRWVKGVVKYGRQVGERNDACFSIGRVLHQCGYSLDEAVGVVMSGPLKELGREEVEQTVSNGWNFARKRANVEEKNA